MRAAPVRPGRAATGFPPGPRGRPAAARSESGRSRAAVGRAARSARLRDRGHDDRRQPAALLYRARHLHLLGRHRLELLVRLLELVVLDQQIDVPVGREQPHGRPARNARLRARLVLFTLRLVPDVARQVEDLSGERLRLPGGSTLSHRFVVMHRGALGSLLLTLGRRESERRDRGGGDRCAERKRFHSHLVLLWFSVLWRPPARTRVGWSWNPAALVPISWAGRFRSLLE